MKTWRGRYAVQGELRGAATVGAVLRVLPLLHVFLDRVPGDRTGLQLGEAVHDERPRLLPHAGGDQVSHGAYGTRGASAARRPAYRPSQAARGNAPPPSKPP